MAQWLRPKGESGPFTLAECEAMAVRDAAQWAARHALAAGTERGITNIVAFTCVENVASRRVMEKLGLT